MKHNRDDALHDSGAGVGYGGGGAPHRTAKDIADMVTMYAEQIEQSHQVMQKTKLPATEEDAIMKEIRHAAKAAPAARQAPDGDNWSSSANIAITATLTRGFSDALPADKLRELERHDTFTKLRIAWTAYSRIPMDKREPVVPAVLLADWANLGRFGPYSKHVVSDEGKNNNNNNNNNNSNNNGHRRSFLFVEVINTRVTQSEGCFAVLAFQFTPQNVVARKPTYVTRDPEFYREAWLVNCYAMYDHMPIAIEDDKSNFQ
jgi:hypothetical protein